MLFLSIDDKYSTYSRFFIDPFDWGNLKCRDFMPSSEWLV